MRRYLSLVISIFLGATLSFTFFSPTFLFAEETAGSEPIDESTSIGGIDEADSTASAGVGEEEVSQSQPEPEYNVSSEATANSFRFQNGYLIDGADTEAPAANAGIMTMSIDFTKNGNTWSKNGNTYSATGTDGSTGMTVSGAKGFGIDVSSWQGSIDWAAVKRSGIVDYAIIRCGWGDDMRSQDDREFLNNVRGCLNNGIPFGIYIYSYAYNTTMAQSEASHVLRLLREAGLSSAKVAYPIYLDLEQQDSSGRPSGMNDGKLHNVSNQMLEQITITFCSTIEDAGYNAGVYANKNWWTNYLTGESFNDWSKWVAQYNTQCTYGGSYDMWQCMSNGRIAGINGNVDINFDFVGLKDFSGNNSTTSLTNSMYRLYNPNSGEHFYTASSGERNNLVRVGWRYEGVAWIAPKSSNTPVYRLYNPVAGDHHYTTSAKERDDVVRAGWRYEGIGWYSDDAKSVVLYRLYNPNAWSGAHHFTTSVEERDHLISVGWRYEGTSWYGVNS